MYRVVLTFVCCTLLNINAINLHFKNKEICQLRYEDNSHLGEKIEIEKGIKLQPWITMKRECIDQARKQIQQEVDASLLYLSMATFFSRDNVNRPGFAKFFFDAASETREHVKKLIKYIMMRGYTGKNMKDLISLKDVQVENWTTRSALVNALKAEIYIINNINTLIKICDEDNKQNYNFVKFLSGDFLFEKYKGQRDLAGKIATLTKMMGPEEGPLAEFLFDKKLLNGGLFS